MRPLAARTAASVVIVFAVLALEQWGSPLAIRGIHAYQRVVSPLAARAGIRCRFEPTCSRYAETVIARDGLVRGGWKTIGRVARCGPWTAYGTHDEP